MANNGKGVVLLPGEGDTFSMPGNKMSFLHREPDSAYALAEWAAEPDQVARLSSRQKHPNMSPDTLREKWRQRLYHRRR